MSFLKYLAQAVGVVAAIYTGGALAGAVMALGDVAADTSKGTLGKFFNSGIGQTVLGAVALGSAAAYNSIANAATTQAGNAAATTSGFLSQNMPNSSQFIQSLQGPESAIGSDLSLPEVNLANEQADAAAASAGAAGVGAAPGTASGNVAANASQVAAQQTENAEAATGASAPGVSSTPIANLNGGQSAGAQMADQQTVVPPSGAATPSANPAATQGTTATDAQAVTPGAQQAAAAAGGAKPGFLGGLLSKVANFAKTPGGGRLIGSMVSGFGNGMAQNAEMDKMIAAQNWGNLQWRNPTYVAQMESAAAAPITVPQGYLSRAAAVRNLMQGGAAQTGPVIGVQPAAGGPVPARALPGAVPAPVGNASMATPRGGVI